MRFRDVLTVEQLVRTADPATRQRVESWSTFQTLRGTIAAAGGGLRVLDDVGADTVYDHTITIPQNSRTRAIKPAMRIRAGGRTFHIESIHDPTGRRRLLELNVRELQVPR